MNSRPLADILRPTSIDEIVGQEHVKPIFKSFEHKKFLPSLILKGPPGCGKTTIARILGNIPDRKFVEISGVSFNTSMFRKIVGGEDIVLFIDEIHHLNKIQQDGLLPHMENGHIILIGSTTENPSFSIIRPLLSRAMVYDLKELEENDLISIYDRARRKVNKEIEKDILKKVINVSYGDARTFINYLEILFEMETDIKEEDLYILLKSRVNYDNAYDEHYDTISAFIKSLRGSDVDASLYYLERMLEGGENPLFILRRMIIFASEDIGNADPRALSLAVSSLHAFMNVGLPEGEYFLYQLTIYLALSPKSDSVKKSMKKTKQFVKDHPNEKIPSYLKSSGVDRRLYKNPHNYKNHLVKQIYMPEKIRDITLFVPRNIGYDSELKKRVLMFDKFFGKKRNE